MWSFSIAPKVCPWAGNLVHVLIDKVCFSVAVSSELMINHNSSSPWCSFCCSLWLRAEVWLVILISLVLLCYFLFIVFFFFLWPNPPTSGCPIFLKPTVCHNSSAQRWVVPLYSISWEITSNSNYSGYRLMNQFPSPTTHKDLTSLLLLSP